MQVHYKLPYHTNKAAQRGQICETFYDKEILNGFILYSKKLEMKTVQITSPTDQVFEL